MVQMWLTASMPAVTTAGAHQCWRRRLRGVMQGSAAHILCMPPLRWLSAPGVGGGVIGRPDLAKYTRQRAEGEGGGGGGGG